MELIGESFSQPVFGVQIGKAFLIKNSGSKPRRLHAPTKPNLLPGDPVNPSGTRKVKLDTAYEIVRIRDKDAPHVEGVIVPIPHPYFAAVDASGKYTIPNVPAGTWRVRVWFGDGWLAGTDGQIEVGSSRATHNIALPSELETTEPSGK
jgi:hypothetical protein